jgi:endo-1,3-1,4-beta-glycanase ExoK
MIFPIIPIIVAGVAASATSCSKTNSPAPQSSDETAAPPARLAAAAPARPVIAPPVAPPPVANTLITGTPALAQEMNADDPTNWQTASWSNGGPFANTWQSDNVSFSNGIMSLLLDKKGCPQSCDGKPYASGEYRTAEEVYGFGSYEARMKGAAGNGLVGGTFFIFRGTYGQQSHDEIDIEILGKDCSVIQTNYYVEGRGGHEQMIPLGFNACSEFHNYGFKWSADSLIFFVDGREVRRINEDPATPARELPYRPGKIMANFWAGTEEVNAWLNGPFQYTAPLTAQYDWIRYSPLGN